MASCLDCLSGISTIILDEVIVTAFSLKFEDMAFMVNLFMEIEEEND